MVTLLKSIVSCSKIYYLGLTIPKFFYPKELSKPLIFQTYTTWASEKKSGDKTQVYAFIKTNWRLKLSN